MIALVMWALVAVGAIAGIVVGWLLGYHQGFDAGMEAARQARDRDQAWWKDYARQFDIRT